MNAPKDNAQQQNFTQYRDHINGLITARFKILTPIGIALIMGFNILDHIVYPEHAALFLKIRALVCLIIVLIYCISRRPNSKPYAPWLMDAIIIVIGSSIALMTVVAGGSSSRYYEGANLVFIGMGVFNPFYFRHMVVSFSILVGLFEIVLLLSPGPFNFINFSFANFFMPSTAFLVTVACKFYKDQHYKAFLSESKLALLYSQADKLAKTDTLTEIHNRRHFIEMLQEKIKTSTSAFHLVIFDVDNFKQLNDRYGHALGDQVLVQIIAIVKKNVRSNDFLGRYGGDEFILCLEIKDSNLVIRRLEKIINDVRTMNLTYKRENIPVSLSIGAATFDPNKKIDETQLIELADQQLLQVKRSGRGKAQLAP